MTFEQRHFDYSRSIIQLLHDVEVNASISSFYDGGWTVKLGDEVNGFIAEAQVGSFEEAERWLYDKAKTLIFTPKAVRDLAATSDKSAHQPDGAPAR